MGSSGHESNAYVAAALRPSDPALLHYRSGAFFLARSMQAGRSLDEALRAVLLSMLASTDDAASGGVVITPKIPIPSGVFVLFTDPAGNRMGLFQAKAP